MHELQVHTGMTISEVKALIEASTLGDVPAEEQHLFNPECVHTPTSAKLCVMSGCPGKVVVLPCMMHVKSNF